VNIRQTAKSLAIGLVVSLALAGVVLAHRGRAGYANEIQTVKGTVADVQWKNPHVFIGFDVKDDKGNVVHWLAELSSPATMLAAGMSRTTLKTGDEVVIKGKLGVDSPIVLVDSITRDGKPVVGDPNAEGRFVNSTR